MNYKKSFNFLKNLPSKLNSFYKKKSRSGIIVNNKSKSKKNFDPVTNFDKAFEKYIRSLIIKKFPKDSIIGEEFKEYTFNSREIPSFTKFQIKIVMVGKNQAKPPKIKELRGIALA